MARTLYLFAVRDYPTDQPAFTAAIDNQLTAAQTWWTHPALGDRALIALMPGPLMTRRDVETAIHDAGLRDLTENDVAVLYITGHGTRTSSGRHYLVLPDTPRGHHLAHGYPTAEIIAAVLASRAEHVVVIVNSCFAGELHAELAVLRKDLPDDRRHSSLAVITTADFDEMPRADEFTTALTETHRYLAREAGYSEPLLSVEAFMSELDASRRRLAADGISLLKCYNVWLGPDDVVNPCLPNPGYQPPPEVAASGGRRQLASTTAELGYWLDRASGRTSAHDPGWYFTGRHELTARIAEFLREGRGMLVVTGAAGTGKSALIARAVTLSDPDFRADPRYAWAVAAAPSETVPPGDSVDLAVLARNKIAEEILTQLVHDAGGPTPRPTDASHHTAALREQLITALAGRSTVTIVIDGVDEATRPTHVITEVIGPLLRHAHIRLIVGVRSSRPDDLRHHAERGALDLLLRFREVTQVTHIRTDGPDTEADIARYLRALATTDMNTLADAIAASVAPSFLDARFAAKRLNELSDRSTVNNAEVLASLQDGTVGLLRQDLADVATDEYPAPVLLAVLRATAFALGAGVPWADIWPAVASAVLDEPVPTTAVAYLLDTRLSGYLTHDTEDGRIVYRPVHESLTELLRDEPGRLLGDQQ